MSTEPSPENEQFIREAVRTGAFRDRAEALDEAVALLKRRLDLLRHIDEGSRQLEAGEYADYDEDDLREFFDEIKAEGRKELELRSRSP